MRIAYYPGCTLKTKAKDLERHAIESAAALGYELCEIENWQCCGGAYTSAKDEIATKLPSVRALAAGRDNGGKVLTVCSACYNVLKQTNHAMQTSEGFAFRVNQYMASEEKQYAGEAEVLHYLELLRDKIGYDVIKEKVVNPLNRKIACYYGCLLLRPSGVMEMDDPENPSIMEDLIRALGGEPVYFPARNECCGGYVVLEDKASADKKATAVCASAQRAEAVEIVTACPLCRYNLEKNSDIPVVYLTELLAEALGVKEEN